MSDNNYVNKTDSNLYPEKVVSTYGSDGSKHTSFVYSLETWATLSLFDFFIFLGFIIALAPLVSAIFLLFYLIRITAKPLPNSHNFFGGLAALYFLVDYHNGWIFSKLIGAFFSMENQYLMLYANLGLLILHTFLFFFGEVLVRLGENNRIASTIYVLFAGLICYLISRGLINNHFITFTFRVD